MSVVNQKIEDGILVIKLNRPEKLNALNDEVLSTLSNIFSSANRQNFK